MGLLTFTNSCNKPITIMVSRSLSLVCRETDNPVPEIVLCVDGGVNHIFHKNYKYDNVINKLSDATAYNAPRIINIEE